jgi:hypothetical protein
MKYYRVKPEYDNVYYSTDFDFLIGNELFTEKEFYDVEQAFLRKCRNRIFALEKFHKMFEIVNLNKNDTYFFFGARFGE